MAPHLCLKSIKLEGLWKYKSKQTARVWGDLFGICSLLHEVSRNLGNEEGRHVTCCGSWAVVQGQQRGRNEADAEVVRGKNKMVVAAENWRPLAPMRIVPGSGVKWKPEQETLGK